MKMKVKIWFRANTVAILLLLFIVIVIIIITATLTSFSSDLIQKSSKFASAQVQTNNNNATTINLREILGTPLYHLNSGKITALRVIDVGEVPKTEVSVMERGTMVGIGNVTNIGTFIETYKTNKIIFGEGKGIITPENGSGGGGSDIITWTSHDIGKINSDRSESYHGIMFFSLDSNIISYNGKLGFLNNTAAIYTTSVGANGSTLRQIWQWKK